ncbi:MAG: radical SAM protein [Treponema sp.]|jgi:radical SAM protein with 4Fe4S-binding SPASM domain|nr:radical SAM protein [Treponema sp.]
MKNQAVQSGVLPITGVIELTYRCNHKCLYCSCPWENELDGYPKYEKGTEFDLTQWKQAMDILEKNGVKNLSLSGGETLLKPELPDILAYIREKNVFNKDKYIVVISNGLAMSEEFLSLFKKYKAHLSLSLPGIDTFERHTGVDNALGVLHWLKRASREGVQTTVNVTVTNINYHELRETISYALIAGADTLLLNRFLIGGRGIRYQDELSLTHEQINGMLDTAEDVLEKARRWGGAGTEIPFCVLKKYEHEYKRLRIGFLCAAAKNFFVVDPAGRIRACNHSPRAVGHIFNDPLIDDTDYWNIFANRDYIPNVCCHCTDISICDCGCREAANITAGSARGVDPCMKGCEKEMSERVEKIEYEYRNDFDRRFDKDFRSLFTERLKEDSKFGWELWSSMANVSWINENDPDETHCRRSFRGAGTLLAVMEGKDKYTKWYCTGPYETVSGYIAEKMASKGWRYVPDGYGTEI